MQALRLAVVMPVYNDWESFASLLVLLGAAFESESVRMSILAVDDGSTEIPDLQSILSGRHLGSIDDVEVLHLMANVGHQRAIAIGLTDAVFKDRFSHVLVMDSDGEDRAEEALRLLTATCDVQRDVNATVVVAQRRRRSEGLAFRMYYAVYKLLFRLLSGETIDFGNFVLMPIAAARRLIHMPETWNHIAASLVKSRMHLHRVATTRGTRLAGRSSMNLVSLVTLGLSAISVYSEAVFVRMLLASLAFLGLAAVGVAAVIGIRLFTPLAIPGWATTAAGLLGILLMQALTISTIASFLALGARSGILTVPAMDASRFIEWREMVGPTSEEHR